MPTFNFKGFSLIEILVTVALIAVITAVTIPNFRKFGQSQEVSAAAQRLADIIRTTQSSAASHIKCPLGQTSTNWNTVLTGSTYTINATCVTSGLRQVSTGSYRSGENSGTVYQMASPQCPGQNVTFVFTGRQIAYTCGSSAGTTWPVRLNLSATGIPDTKTVVVESGGVIRVE